MTLDPDFCRSLMFLPADNERFRNSALRGSADIIILDLEDAIPASKKDRVRDGIQSAIHDIAEANRICAVRINSGLRLLGKDLEAVICPGLSALTIPKVPSAELLKMIDETVSDLESERDIPVGNIRLIAQIETATGLQNINDIARSTPRLAAIGIGSEDLAADLGSQAEKEILYYPSMQVLIAARSAGIVPLGYLGSITVYNETDTYRGWIQQARKFGFEGAFCIHPRQVEILNEEFLPSADEVAEAETLIKAFEAHKEKGIGAFTVDDRMVDAPVIDRARRILKRNHNRR